MKQLVVGVAVSAALIAAAALGSRTRAERSFGERSLRATWFAHGMTCMFVVFLVGIAALGWNETRSEQLIPLLLLIAGFGLGLILWVWYFYARVVYWNNIGVGLRRPFRSPQFIEWQHIDRAGRALFFGDFHFQGGRTKIYYTKYHGGYEQLNRLAKRKLARLEPKF